MAFATSHSVSMDEWRSAKYDFIRSVFRNIDEGELYSQLQKCETEDDVQGIFESLLMFHDPNDSGLFAPSMAVVSDQEFPQPGDISRNSNELEFKEICDGSDYDDTCNDDNHDSDTNENSDEDCSDDVASGGYGRSEDSFQLNIHYKEQDSHSMGESSLPFGEVQEIDIEDVEDEINAVGQVPGHGCSCSDNADDQLISLADSESLPSEGEVQLLESDDSDSSFVMVEEIITDLEDEDDIIHMGDIHCEEPPNMGSSLRFYRDNEEEVEFIRSSCAVRDFQEEPEQITSHMATRMVQEMTFGPPESFRGVGVVQEEPEHAGPSAAVGEVHLLEHKNVGHPVTRKEVQEVEFNRSKFSEFLEDVQELELESPQAARVFQEVETEHARFPMGVREAQATFHSHCERDSQIASFLDMVNNLFPDAVSEFLQEKIDKLVEIAGDPQKLNLYAEELLKIKKYPKMKDRMKIQKGANAGGSDLQTIFNGFEDEQVEVKLLVQCTICLEDKTLDLETGSCNARRGEHIYCIECIKRYVNEEIEQSRSTFKCMERDCKAEFSLRVLRRILEPSVLSNILERRQHEEICAAGIENLESCPFCQFKAIVPNPFDRIFSCLNTECLMESCRLCKEESHIPLRCEEVEKDPQLQARKRLENKMSEAMIRECPQCHKRFIKNEGCNNITCSCGASICYFCKQLTNSTHHLNSTICGQTTDENVIHAQEVRKAALEGRQQMDPNIRLVHDPTAGIL